MNTDKNKSIVRLTISYGMDIKERLDYFYIKWFHKVMMT